jgi:hypothetical protein
MSQSIAEHRRNSFYSSPSEIKARQDKVRAPTPLELLRIRHLDERNALGDRCRLEGRELDRVQRNRRGKDRAVVNGALPPPQLVKQEKSERAAMEAHHQSLRATLKAKQDKAELAEIARHPAP